MAVTYPGTALYPGGSTFPGTSIGSVGIPDSGTPQWSVFARGVDYGLGVALPIGSLQAVVRHLGLDKAVLSTPFTPEAWEGVQPGNGVAAYRNGQQVFAGPVWSRQLAWDGQGAATIRVEAVGDEVALARRLTFPDPLRAATDQTVNDYWSYTGTASAAMARLISDQAGPTCAASRRVAGLTITDAAGVGVSKKWTGLFDPVLTLLTNIAATSGADPGLRMSTTTGSLAAYIVAPRDLSGSVVFSADLSNVGSTTFTETAPETTHALAAGQGDLHLRTRRLSVTTDSGSLRWGQQAWTYVDRRDSADAAELDQSAAEALVEGQGTVALSLTLTSSVAATYGIDWDLGDKVTAYVGLPSQPKVAVVSEAIREITFTVDADGGERIQPAIGSVDARTYLPTPQQRALAAVVQRADALVRNK